MNTFTSKARAAALAAGATIVASAAMAPNANAWVNNNAACSGSPIVGGGASFQNLAQQGFGATILKNSPFTLGVTQIGSLAVDPGFAAPTSGFGFTSASTLDCESFGGSVVKYTPIGSGAGRNSWRANGTTPRDTTAAFVSSDEAPNTTEQDNMQKSGMTSTGSQLETLPVAQASIPFYVNLPANCSSTGRGTKLSTVEQVYEGDFGAAPTFAQLLPNRVTGAGCATPINIVVRTNSSGTSFAIKKLFASIDSDWNALSTPATNTTWPIPVTPGGTSNTAVANTVAVNPGSIGFGDLGSVRSPQVLANADYNWQGAGDNKYMVLINVPLRGGTPGQTVTVDPAIDSDATNGISAKGSNCGTTRAYQNVPLDTAGAPTTRGSLTNPALNWFAVEGSNPAGYTFAEYPGCSLTYMFAYDLYKRFPGMTEAQARTVYDYARFVTSSTAQNALVNNDYQKVPSALRTAAGQGALRINW